MRVLVTHAEGLLGAHLCRRLGAEGHEALTLEPGEIPAAAARRQKPEAVVYLGAVAGDEDPSPAQAGARLGELGALLEVCAASGLGHLVIGSGAAVYGAGEKLPFGVAQPLDRPLSNEGALQRAAELLAWGCSQTSGLPVTALRFFTVYGPRGRPGGAVRRFLRAAKEGAEVELHDGGTMRRDFTYVDDAVEILLRAVERPPTPTEEAKAYAAYNVGTGTPTPVSRLVQLVEEVTGRKLPTRDAPRPPTALPHTWADVRDLQHAYGFRPRTPLKDGVAATWAAERENRSA